MKKVFIILWVVMFFVPEVKAQLLSYPNDGSYGVPSGFVELNAQVPPTEFYVNPNVAGSVSWSENTLISYTIKGHLGPHGYANNVYNPPTKCNSLVRTPTQGFAENNNYFATPFGYGGYTFSTNSFTLLSPTVVKVADNFSYMKPTGAICDKGIVALSQDKTGVHAQRFSFIFDIDGITPIGLKKSWGEILVAGPEWYSDAIGSNIAMNSSCKFAISYLRDWHKDRLTYADIRAYVSEWGVDTGIARAFTVQQKKAWNPYINRLFFGYGDYAMQFRIGSPSIGILNDGSFILSALVPKAWENCKGCTRVPNWFADNYFMSWKYTADASYVKNLGVTSDVNSRHQTFHAALCSA